MSSLGSSIVVVAFLLGGAAWCVAIQSARIVVGLLWRGCSSCESFLFLLSRRCWHCFLFSSLFLSFRLDCAVLASALASMLYRVVAILI